MNIPIKKILLENKFLIKAGIGGAIGGTLGNSLFDNPVYNGLDNVNSILPSEQQIDIGSDPALAGTGLGTLAGAALLNTKPINYLKGMKGLR